MKYFSPGGCWNMSRRVVLAVFLIGVLFVQTAFAGADLSCAVESMNSGNYLQAIGLFDRIVKDKDASPNDRREGLYYMGFCFVKLNDPWSAAKTFETFLFKYQHSDDKTFVPDVFYVLGRTYEGMGQFSQAENMYRSCIDLCPRSEYARKSDDRLRVIKGDHAGGNGHGPGPVPGLHHRQVAPKNANTNFEINPVLIEYTVTPSVAKHIIGAGDETLKQIAHAEARTGKDFIAICRAASTEDTRFSICCILVCRSYVMEQISPNEIREVASMLYDPQHRDRFLIDAVSSANVYYSSDFRALEDMAVSVLAKEKIRNIAAKNAGHAFTSVLEAGSQTSSLSENGSLSPEKPVAVPSDPFVGFSLDQERIKRVKCFVEAVATKKGMKAAAEKLTREDMSLDVVKQSMKDYSVETKFDELHKQ